jgi:hypothetical protein
MKDKFALTIRIAVLFFAWFKFQLNSFLNYYNWYRMIVKSHVFSWVYRKQFFVIPKSKTSLMTVNYFFVGYYNEGRKRLKLDNREKFDQFKMKRISINTLIDKSYYKTKRPGS